MVPRYPLETRLVNSLHLQATGSCIPEGYRPGDAPGGSALNGDFLQYLRSWSDQIDCCIGSFFPRTISEDRYRALAGGADEPADTAAWDETVARPAWDLLARRKKYWRPLFGILLFESLGKDPGRYRMLLSVVPELTHTGTLIIDDIEDRSPVRRGDQSIHTRYGTDVAINAANTLYFLPLVMYREHPDLTDSQRLDLYELTYRTQLRGHMGQAQDIWWTKNVSEKNLMAWRGDGLAGKILRMYDLKTASPAVAVAEACCILAGADWKTKNACTAFAHAFGTAFQITNDLLSFMPSGYTDKTPGEDLIAGKLTYVIVRAMDLLETDDCQRFITILCTRELQEKPEILKEGIALVRKSGAVAQCQREAWEMVDRAWEELSRTIPPSEFRLRLRVFTRALVDLSSDTGRA